MKTRELKGYNIVGVKGDAGIYQVVAIDVYDQKVKLSYPRNEWHLESKLKPIPLTEEWLVKLGFVFQDGVWHNQIALYPGSTGFNYNVNFFEYDNLHTVEYVHQLQNLYLALTGEELIINNP